MKYLIEVNGKRYVENHDIRAQLNMLKKMGLSIPKERDLRLLATTLNSWEAETRYNDNFVSLDDDIQEAFSIADELVSYADAMVEQKGGQKMTSFPSDRLK